MNILQTTSIKLTFYNANLFQNCIKKRLTKMYTKLFKHRKDPWTKFEIYNGLSSFFIVFRYVRIVAGDFMQSYKRLDLMYPRKSCKRRIRYYLACKYDLQTLFRLISFSVIFIYDIQYDSAWNTLNRVVKYKIGRREMVTGKWVHSVKY